MEAFQHRKTGRLYFSSACQAAEPAVPAAAIGNDASCQASDTSASAVQTDTSVDTQTPAPGWPAHTGRVLSASARSTSTLDADASAATLIQARARGWLARKRLAQEGVAADCDGCGGYAAAQQAANCEADSEAEAERQRVLQRQLHPKSPADFEFLHEQVRRWMAKETEAVKAADMTGDERKAALLALCKKEIKYLQTIDRRWAAVQRAARAGFVKQRLRREASPARWPVCGGIKVVHVTTPAVARAKEIADMHERLSGKLTPDGRLEALVQARTVLRAVSPHNEAFELVERELDLLNRGRGRTALHVLRQRILDALESDVQQQHSGGA